MIKIEQMVKGDKNMLCDIVFQDMVHECDLDEQSIERIHVVMDYMGQVDKL